jgi:hypothetical protein
MIRFPFRHLHLSASRDVQPFRAPSAEASFSPSTKFMSSLSSSTPASISFHFKHVSLRNIRVKSRLALLAYKAKSPPHSTLYTPVATVTTSARLVSCRFPPFPSTLVSFRLPHGSHSTYRNDVITRDLLLKRSSDVINLIL